MIAAIYARKSTEQAMMASDQKSVARQIEHARSYAGRNGWQVLEECIYVDDGISGAEFSRRPGFVRLMNALQPRPAFDVLIMSEESRDSAAKRIETAYALKQIITAGVRVHFYLDEARERTLESPTANTRGNRRRCRRNEGPSHERADRSASRTNGGNRCVV